MAASSDDARSTASGDRNQHVTRAQPRPVIDANRPAPVST